MSMMMRKMGIEMRDIDHVQEVIVRTRDREYRFNRPSVSVMKAQGTETWQVQGKPTTHELVAGPAASPNPATTGKPTAAPTSASTPTATVPTPTPTPTAPVKLEVPEEDVRMVMEQTGKDRATARRALEECGGDLAEAIVKLS